jgi:hypothetical protein
VVELPAGDPVEDRRVLDRVGVADLVRTEVERLEVLGVAVAPDHAVEAALPADPQLELDRSVLELVVESTAASPPARRLGRPAKVDAPCPASAQFQASESNGTITRQKYRGLYLPGGANSGKAS